ncbi:MAG: RNA pseudouridine synthase [Deltaproteobacteria bacterium]|nr:RNA pseudouridine synthase [Deltaproteobacteria bacterium]
MSAGSRPGGEPPADPRPPVGRWQVGPAEGGTRLDAFLARVLGISRANARRTLSSGAVTWRGRRADLSAKGAPLQEGDAVEVAEVVDPARAHPVADPAAPLAVLAEGEGWLAVDKPAGTPVHPLSPDERGTLLNALAARQPGIVGVGEGGLRSGVVHRLDVETSGVMLFATAEGPWQRLREAFRRHQVEKVYWALARGRLEGQSDLELQLAVTQHRPARVRVVSPDDAQPGRGRPTRLAWRSLAVGDDASLIEGRPATGFLHQIRASLAHLGHPLYGDRAYGGPEHPLAPRHLLHARMLRWREVEATCEPPEDFARARDALIG